jgi:hypothetical protein
MPKVRLSPSRSLGGRLVTLNLGDRRHMVMYLHPKTAKLSTIVEPVRRCLVEAGDDCLAIGDHMDAWRLRSVVVSGEE